MSKFEEIVYENEDKYFGEAIDKIPHGLGIYEYNDGSKYVGQFRNGRRNGKGTLYLIGKQAYSGDWKNDEIDGWGEYTYDNDDKYIGSLKNGVRDGEGIYIYKNGAKEIGEFRSDRLDGKAIMKYDKENISILEFKNDEKNGIDIECLDENVYSLKFWESNLESSRKFFCDKYGLLIGNRVEDDTYFIIDTYNSYDLAVNIVKNSKFIEEKMKISLDNSIYIGKFDDNNSGYGKIIKNDDEYDGYFINGKMVTKDKIKKQDENKDKMKFTYNNELMKIGKFVLYSLKDLLDNKIISEEILRNLQDKEYCKNEINVNYPLLLKIDPNSPFSDQIEVNGRPRYLIKDTLYINNCQFAICSQWYEWNALSYRNWFDGMKNILEYGENNE